MQIVAKKANSGVGIDMKAMMGSRSAANPAARLLNAARELFYEQGYNAAGINEIIAQSNTSKKSFYRYFPSKRDLGEAYLKSQAREMIGFLEWLQERATDYRHFCRLWSRSLALLAARPDYRGCPFSNAMAQAPEEFAPLVRDVHELCVLKLQDIIGRFSEAEQKHPPDHTAWLAEGMLLQYLGAVHTWKLSGKRSIFRQMESMLLILPRCGPV